MSEDLQKALDNALSRIAQLESSRAPQRSGVDMEQLRNALTNDPMGTLQRIGVPVEHVTRVAVANVLGDKASPELRALAAMGPQYSATHALDSKTEALSRQLSDFIKASKQKDVRQSFEALVRDKTKYPHLADAYAADPSLFASDMEGYEGDASDLAGKVEKRLAAVAAIYKPKAESDENSVNSDKNQSTQVQPAGGVKPDVPPLPQAKPGLFTPEDHAALRDRIVRKYESKGSA